LSVYFSSDSSFRLDGGIIVSVKTLALLGLAVCSFLAFGCNEVNAPGELPANATPLGTTLEGHALTTADFQGRVTLVCFWASWCGIATHAFTDLETMWSDFNFMKDASLVAISVDSDEAALRAYLGDKTRAFYITRGDAEVQRIFQVTGIPTYFMFDRLGNQCWRCVGYAPPDSIQAAVSRARLAN
jgi:redoxin